MNRRLAVLMVVALLLPATTLASSSSNEFDYPGCGAVLNRNTSHQFGPYNWLEYIVETQGAFDICGQWIVSVSAYVVNVANSSLFRTGLMYASARRTVPVPQYGMWETRGSHFASGSIPNPFCSSCGGMWPTGQTVSHADIRPPEVSLPDDDDEGCPPPNPERSYSMRREANLPCSSPIIVDTARDGYKLTSVERGVPFDLNADGTADLVAWTRAGSDDAFLAMDRNGNGRIDDGSELFGDHTPAHADRSDQFTANGFEALAYLNSPSYGISVSDRQVDRRDAAFSRLLLWRDSNHNGISEPDELSPAAAAGVAAIGTDYKEKKRVDRHGNEFRQKGRITWADGAVEPVYDVWLQWRR